MVVALKCIYYCSKDSLLFHNNFSLVRLIYDLPFAHKWRCDWFLSTSFLTTSHRLLQFSSSAASAEEETSEAPSSPTSPRGVSSQSSSNLPSPLPACTRSGRPTWPLDSDLSPTRTPTHTSVPSPSALQDNSSQNAQSSRKSFN